MKGIVRFTIIFDIALLVAALTFLAVGDAQFKAFVLMGILLGVVIAYCIVSTYVTKIYRQTRKMTHLKMIFVNIFLEEWQADEDSNYPRFTDLVRNNDFSYDTLKQMSFKFRKDDPFGDVCIAAIDYLLTLDDFERMYFLRGCKVVAENIYAERKNKDIVEEIESEDAADV